MGGAVALLVVAFLLLGSLGRSFLPEFNEGALTVSAVTLPGTSLAESDRMGRRIEERLLTFPGMVVTFGQPLSHRIDHMLSGTRANIAPTCHNWRWSSIGKRSRVTARTPASWRRSSRPPTPAPR